jgi:sterol desaturase/sphingolipid hydroxylase (fatty acid hydroxylase superfamily)
VAEAYFGALFGLLTYQLIGVALFLPFELAFPRARASFADRSRGILFLLAVAPFTALISAMLSQAKTALHIEPLFVVHHSAGAPVLASIALALWIDLQFYTVHRIEHRFLWRFHQVHHSIQNLSAANSYHHWTEPLWLLTIAIPLMFVDVQIGPTLGVLTFLFTFQQFYIHSASRPNFGRLRWLLADNVYHRIHHSTDPAHYDRNFGAMTPLWDWLFGTLYMPGSDEWPDVGLSERNEPTTLRDWHLLPWRSDGSEHPEIEAPRGRV